MQYSLDFDMLIPGLVRRLQQPLPRESAYEALRATFTGADRPDFHHKNPAKPGAVLILLYPDEGKIKIPLTKRADYQGTHSGQISFPGGKREPDEDDVLNALRESEEEIGLSRENVKIIGKLSEFFVIASNYIVTPVVGYCDRKPIFKLDQIEAVRILECDLGLLVADDAIKQGDILVANKYPMLAPYFDVEGEVVWGATAMMLNELRLVVREVSTTTSASPGKPYS